MPGLKKYGCCIASPRKAKTPPGSRVSMIKLCVEVTTLNTIIGKIRNEKLFMQLLQLYFAASSRPFLVSLLT